MLFLTFQTVFSMLVKYYHTNLFCKGNIIVREIFSHRVSGAVLIINIHCFPH